MSAEKHPLPESDDTTGGSPAFHSEVAGRDLDEARALYEGDYNGSDFQAERSEKEFSYRYTVTGDADMTLRSSQFLGNIVGSIQPADEYIVSWITSGSGITDVGAAETELVLGRPAMFPTGKRFAFQFSDYRQNLVHFNAAYLERIAAEHEGTLPGPLHFDHTIVPSADALRRWKVTISTVAESVLGAGSTPVLRAEAKRMAATVLLDTFAHRAAPLPEVLLQPRNGRLRAAVEFIHEHAELPITPTEVAKAADLSLRGLQVAFRRQLDTTPTDYVRDVRLDRARAELANLGPRETSVGVVARRWGFVHLGRFSAAYSERFGELPHETLHH